MPVSKKAISKANTNVLVDKMPHTKPKISIQSSCYLCTGNNDDKNQYSPSNIMTFAKNAVDIDGIPYFQSDINSSDK